MAHSFEKLKEHILRRSQAQDFREAAKEWDLDSPRE